VLAQSPCSVCEAPLSDVEIPARLLRTGSSRIGSRSRAARSAPHRTRGAASQNQDPHVGSRLGRSAVPDRSRPPIPDPTRSPNGAWARTSRTRISFRSTAVHVRARSVREPITAPDTRDRASNRASNRRAGSRIGYRRGSRSRHRPAADSSSTTCRRRPSSPPPPTDAPLDAARDSDVPAVCAPLMAPRIATPSPPSTVAIADVNGDIEMAHAAQRKRTGQRSVPGPAGQRRDPPASLPAPGNSVFRHRETQLGSATAPVDELGLIRLRAGPKFDIVLECKSGSGAREQAARLVGMGQSGQWPGHRRRASARSFSSSSR
jgi:hypothetical protein